jgi:GntR family transcriptional regulator
MMARIEDGTWRRGGALPNEIQLSREFEVSIGTVRKAVEGLELAGLIFRRPGRGTFVSPRAASASLKRFPISIIFGDKMVDPPLHVVRLTKRQALSKEARNLSLGSADHLFDLERHGVIGERTVISHRSLIPARLVPELDKLGELPSDLFALFRNQFGLVIARVTDRICVVQPASNETDRALLRLERTARLADGRPVEIATIDVDADYIELSAVAPDR